MRFRYSKLPGIPTETKRPLVPVKFKYKTRETLPILALIDSGADFSYASKEIADFLGIDLSRVKREPSFGIDGSRFLCFPTKAEIEINGHNLMIPIHFTLAMNKLFRCVLGQEGLFDQAKITFKRYKWSFEIKVRNLKK